VIHSCTPFNPCEWVSLNVKLEHGQAEVKRRYELNESNNQEKTERDKERKSKKFNEIKSKLKKPSADKDKKKLEEKLDEKS
jgi:hypothetical protein